MKFEIELPRAGLPSDREVTGVRYDRPKEGEYYIASCGVWNVARFDYTEGRYLIADLAPVEVWRPATVEDAIKALRGETVKCRGWDNNPNKKENGVLTGKIPTDIYPWGVVTDSHGASCYTNCEVLDIQK